MMRTPDHLEEALMAVFSRNGAGCGVPITIRRAATPYVTTFPCEIVTCRFADGARLRLFCKYAARDTKCSFGPARRHRV